MKNTPALAFGSMVALATAMVSAQSVDRLWSSNCTSCHGNNGQGGGAGAKSLLTDPLFGQEYDRTFFDAIKKGIPEKGMPAYGESLNDTQVWSLVVHIRELQLRDYRSRVGGPKATSGFYQSKHHSYRVETVIGDGIETPWSVDFLPDGRMLVTEKNGALRIHSTGKPGGTLSGPISGTPKVRNRGQGGLMDVAVHPDFGKPGGVNDWVYLAFSDEIEVEGKKVAFTKIVRGRIDEKQSPPAWTSEQTIWQAKPEHYLTGDLHYGCRIVFSAPEKDGKRYVFFGIGERGRGELAQKLDRPNGKVYRLWDDGRVPSDNPFVSDDDKAKGHYPAIWSYGHRNPQGLVIDLDGQVWDTEHGPRGGDELNAVQKGKNYGWPVICFGINYNDTPFATPWPKEGQDFTMPTYRWLPSIAACGLDVVRPGKAGETFSKWRGDFVAGGLAGETVQRVRVAKNDKGEWTLVEREELIHGMGRVRDVVCGPDGSVYVVLNGPDQVVCLTTPQAGVKK
jgi:glucose/arabinose dehydrogenase